jgi:hypothetical protein
MIQTEKTQSISLIPLVYLFIFSSLLIGFFDKLPIQSTEQPNELFFILINLLLIPII